MSIPRLIFAVLALLVLSTPAAAAARFEVAVEGNGPDVILIPGLASSQRAFDATAQRLRPRFRLHRITVAGFAGSAVAGNGDGAIVASLANEIAAYIGREKLRAPAIIGHSLGGETALMIAARDPEAAARILVIDALPFYSLLFSPSATVEAVRPQADAMRDMLLQQSPEARRASQAPVAARLVRSEPARAGVVSDSLASDPATVARAMHELMTTDLRPELGGIRAKVTVLYAYDPVYGVPAESVDGLFRAAYANLPGATLKRVDGSYHFIMYDQPAAFAAAVDAFLAGE